MKKIKVIISALVIGTMALTALSGVSAVFGMGLLGSEGEIDPSLEIPKPIIKSGDYGYQINADDTITIAEYYGKDPDIVIPEELDGYKVTAIGYQAFTYLDMESLIIPDTVETIEPRAFEYCTISKDLVFPERVTVRSSAFSYAILPQVVLIPAGATLQKDAFSYNEHVEILCIGAGACAGESAFGYSEDLVAVVCADGSTLEDDAFEYSYDLEQAVLCGDVQLEGDPFSYCDLVQVSHANADDFATVIEALKSGDDGGQKEETPKGLNPQGWFGR